MFMYCFLYREDTYLVSLFANAAGIIPEIAIDMKSFVFLALAIIAGVLTFSTGRIPSQSRWVMS